jgi:lipopolysaccharide export system protein LptC
VALRMKNSSTSIIPLAMMLLLAALTFWLSQVIQGRTPRGPLRHDPDYWAERVELRRFDINGTLQHTLVAEKLVHYPDDDTTIVTEPHLTYHKLPPIEVFARMGYVGRDGKEVDLVDDVRVVRHSAAGDAPATQLETRTLKIFPDAEKGHTDDPVVITQGKSIMKGSGLDIDNRSGITVLRGRVTGTLHRNRTETP